MSPRVKAKNWQRGYQTLMRTRYVDDITLVVREREERRNAGGERRQPVVEHELKELTRGRLTIKDTTEEELYLGLHIRTVDSGRHLSVKPRDTGKIAKISRKSYITEQQRKGLDYGLFCRNKLLTDEYTWEREQACAHLGVTH
ncbi:unnamed protein product [Amoebophrya sp. A25]|nr:unnamed protein product [Amoebophrya sp. A25]|eukprot:GSA25T00023058001.1